MQETLYHMNPIMLPSWYLNKAISNCSENKNRFSSYSMLLKLLCDNIFFIIVNFAAVGLSVILSCGMLDVRIPPATELSRK